MVASEEVMVALKGIGLNSYERKLWTALLSCGTATAGKLADIAGVPRSRTYDVMESLAKKGYAMIKPTKPIEYVAISPDEAFDKATKVLRSQHDESVRKIEGLRNSHVHRELQNIYEQGIEYINPGDVTGIVKTRKLLSNQLDQMLEKASNRVNILASQEGLKEIASKSKKLQKASKRGADIRIAGPIDAADPAAIEKLKSFAQVRKTVELVGEIFMADKEILLPLTDAAESSGDVAIWGKSSYAATETMEPLFDQLWNRLEPA